MKNAYNIALGDWFNPPVIHCVDRVQVLVLDIDIFISKPTL